MVQRRLRRKRRSGHGRYGNEVTSGFDRHRMVSSDSSSESDQSEAEKEPKKKSKQSEDNRNWSRSFSLNFALFGFSESILDFLAIRPPKSTSSAELEKYRKQNEELKRHMEENERQKRTDD